MSSLFCTLQSLVKCRLKDVVGKTPPMKMEETEGSETSAYKIQTPENRPEERIKQNLNLYVSKY
jgi:hypothetical protein